MDWNRLGAFVKQRRASELGLSQSEVTSRGGPSVPTLRQIENGVAGNFRAQTFAELEKALQWAPGSAQRILQGGDPTEARSTDSGVNSSESNDVEPRVMIGLPVSAGDLSVAEREEIEAAAKAAALRVWREIRGNGRR